MTRTIEMSPSYRYDQKAALRAAVLSFVRRFGANSLLDIGAGFLDTALAYQQAVARYHAVEQDPGRHSVLASSGIEATLGVFPCQVPGVYDLVLSSHSIPEEPRLHREFVARAWDAVAPRGRLVLITFKGVLDQSCLIRAELAGRPPRPFDEASHAELLHQLQRIAPPACSKITSTERTDVASDIAQRFCTRSDAIDEACLARASNIVSQSCFTRGHFELAHVHNVIVLHKQA